MLKNKVSPYIRLMRLDKPIGILLLMWPTLIALWLASEGIPEIKPLIVFVLGVVLMRSAGCVINDYADRDIDGHVWRTQMRPLAAGELTSKQALILFAGLAFVSFLLVLSLNTMTVWMSVVGLALAALYPFMKRYTYFPQVFLGMAFGWAIPMAFTAVGESVPVVAWLLFLANIIWSVIYDTFYAMADREDDLLAGVKSTAILFGEDDLVIIAVLQVLFLAVLFVIGKQLSMSWPYYLAMLASLGLFAYQLFLAREREPQRCLQAFLNNNWVGGALFIGTACHFLLQSF